MRKKSLIALFPIVCCLCAVAIFGATLNAEAQESANLFALSGYENTLRGETHGAKAENGRVLLGEYFSGCVTYTNDYIDAKEFFVDSRGEYVNGDGLDFTMSAKVEIESVMAGSQNYGLGLYIGTLGSSPVFVKLQANGKTFVNAYNLTSDTTIQNVGDGMNFTMKIRKSQGEVEVFIDSASVLRFDAGELKFATGIYNHYAKGTFGDFSFKFDESVTVDPPAEKDERPVWDEREPDRTANTEYIEPPLPEKPSEQKKKGCKNSATALGSALGAVAAMAGIVLLISKKANKKEIRK